MTASDLKGHILAYKLYIARIVRSVNDIGSVGRLCLAEALIMSSKLD